MSASLREAYLAVREAEAAGKETVTLTLAPRLALLMIDAAIPHYDPDMPAPSVCRALGPLVGDVVMNGRLRRLNETAQRLEMVAERLDAFTTLMRKR